MSCSVGSVADIGGVKPHCFRPSGESVDMVAVGGRGGKGGLRMVIEDLVRRGFLVYMSE